MSNVRKEAEEKLHEAVAKTLMEFTSENIRDSIHRASILEHICYQEGDDETAEKVAGVKEDLEKLHRVMLVFQADPEIIKRNWIAMLFNALSPFIVSMEEYVTGEDRPLWQLGISSSVILTEAMGALQYLSSVQIMAGVHFEEELMTLQVRSYEISMEKVSSPEEVVEAADSVKKFFDEARGLDLTPAQKPSMLLVLHFLVFLMSYKTLRNSLSK